MNKRGQVYILAALIISVVVFILVLRPNVIIQEKFEDDFEKLSGNYEYESTRFTNSLINQDLNVSSSFFNFTLLFTSYSKSQNPNFNLIYAFGLGDEINVGNFMEEEIVIDDGSSQYLLNGCYDKIGAVIEFQGLNFESDIDYGEIEECLLTIDFVSNIWLGIGGLWYPFEIESRPQIIIISQEEAEEQRKVFIGGEGFKKGGGQGRDEEQFCNLFSNEESCSNHEVCCWESNSCTANCDD